MKLKPCPFCGNSKVKLHDSYLPPKWYWVSCDNCKTEGPIIEDGTKEDAMEAWNNRVIISD